MMASKISSGLSSSGATLPSMPALFSVPCRLERLD
jgi:hypothetical protein